MMRSLYSGVSGLQNHQVRMDVLGNNISNVNTTGFKKGRVNFQDMLSQTLSGAAKPTEDLGGVNPKQIGLGMSIASIDTLFQQGSLQTTGNKTDIAIQGSGFFVMKDGDKNFYTRSGAFSVDKDGILVNPANGMKVQGWMAQQIGGEDFVNTAGDVEDLIIPIGSKDPAQATSEVFLACNLNKNTPEIPADNPTEAAIREGSHFLTKDIYDSFGNVYTMRMDFTKVQGVENRWAAEVQVTPQDPANADAPMGVLSGLAEDAATWADNEFFVEFDNNGAIQLVQDDVGGLTADEGQLQIPIAFNVPSAVNAEAPGTPVRQQLNVNLGEVGSFSQAVTQTAERTTTKAVEQNGYGMGYLEDFQIDNTGQITGVYSNGTKRLIGQIAVGSFTNPNGLEKAGESTYVVSNNSGDANIGTSGVAGKGKLISGTLEMSNVDLAEQFVDMIVTQRGFQANSKTITTSDQMLQELMTLKR